MDHAFAFVSEVSHLTMMCERRLNVGMEMLVAFDSEPFVNLSGRASCSFRTVVGEMVEASWVHDNRLDAWERSDPHYGSVVQKAGTEKPMCLYLNASKEFVRFVLVALTLW